MKKAFYGCFLLIFIFLFSGSWCNDTKPEDKNSIPANSVIVRIDGQKVNFIKPVSYLRFEPGVYGEYIISEIWITLGNEPPLPLKLPDSGGGTIQIGNKTAEIDFDYRVSIYMLNQPWNKVGLKGVQINRQNNYCAIYLQAGKK
ncbi:MAG TPA: hypothetical protein PLK76_03285 [bacterium]|nr:hypothetical protein [bacterium]